MTHEIHTPSVRPPVALGCAAMVAVVALLAGAVVFAVTFLESGSDSSRAVLDPVDAYPPDSFAFEPEHHIYLVRIGPARFFALHDLDASNRAAQGRRCRVVTADRAQPAFRGVAERFSGRQSPGAAQFELFFYEECNGAVYDATGIRLDRDGRNLDRYPVEIDDAGRVVVDFGKRQCSRREGTAFFLEEKC
ncbi:MAG: hypothetical protein ACKVVT_19000 [Dehalococcoidia bacterium]